MLSSTNNNLKKTIKIVKNMSKTKKSNSALYEILYIVSNKFSEDEVEKIDKKVEKIIKENKGIITNKESLGKKRLAYPIKKFDYGYYNLIVFDTQKLNIANIDRLVRQMREILRYCIVLNVPKQIIKKKIEPVVKPKKEKSQIVNLSDKEEDVDKTDKVTQEGKIKEEKKSTKDDKKSDKVVIDKTDQDNLDQKLDDIIEAKNLF